jgi:hypothetical protein
MLNIFTFFGPKILAHHRKNLKLTSAVKILISCATRRYTTFTLIVARRFHQKFAMMKNVFFNLKGPGPLNLKKCPAAQWEIIRYLLKPLLLPLSCR